MRAEAAVNIEDLHRLARRRLPRIAFDYIEGGCDDETGLDHNEAAFRRRRLVARYLVDMTQRQQSVTLFGRRYASPFGIAPTGIAALFHPNGDQLLAEAARDADIPFIQSGFSTSSVEAVARVAPEHAWYQLYQPADMKVTEDILRRAREAGVRTLVLTVDSQTSSNRERNTRNGFTQPLKMTTSTVLEALLHPGWVAGYLRHGMPVLGDWVPYAGSTDPKVIAKYTNVQGRAGQSWRDVEHIRQLWAGNFVLKGILHRADAVRAVEAGVDGLIISNHGGRALDRAPAPIEVLPGIREAVGDRMTLMLDSGIRRGSDILTALCLGANFCFVGRATLYGLAAGGLPGVRRAIAILRNEIHIASAQLGCPDLSALTPDLVMGA